MGRHRRRRVREIAVASLRKKTSVGVQDRVAPVGGGDRSFERRRLLPESVLAGAVVEEHVRAGERVQRVRPDADAGLAGVSVRDAEKMEEGQRKSKGSFDGARNGIREPGLLGEIQGRVGDNPGEMAA